MLLARCQIKHLLPVTRGTRSCRTTGSKKALKTNLSKISTSSEENSASEYHAVVDLHRSELEN